MSKKVVPHLLLGFLGMIICHFGLFVCSMAGIPFMAYIIVYPVVYCVMTAMLTAKEPQLWLSNALLLLALPALYWYALLWTDGRLNVASFTLLESSGMSVIIPMTIGLSLLVGFMTYRSRTPVRTKAR